MATEAITRGEVSVADLSGAVFALCNLVKELESQLPPEKKFLGPICIHCDQRGHLGINCLERP